MAVQYHVAHSATIRGAAVFAGKPYWCEKGVTRAVSHGNTDDCLKHPDQVDVSSLVQYASTVRKDARHSLHPASTWKKELGGGLFG